MNFAHSVIRLGKFEHPTSFNLTMPGQLGRKIEINLLAPAARQTLTVSRFKRGAGRFPQKLRSPKEIRSISGWNST